MRKPLNDRDTKKALRVPGRHRNMVFVTFAEKLLNNLQ